MQEIYKNKKGECVIVYNKKPKTLNHRKLQKKFCNLLLKLEKQKRENYIYTGKITK